MWKILLSLAGRFWRIAEETERNRTQIEVVKTEIQSMWRAIDALAFEIQRLRETDAHEREKLALQLENALLKFERRLPPSKSKD